MKETQIIARSNRYNTLIEVANLVKELSEQEVRVILPRPLPVPIQGGVLPHLVLRRNDKRILNSLLISQVDILLRLLEREKERLIFRNGGPQDEINPFINHPLNKILSEIREPAVYQINEFVSFIEQLLGYID